jgi:hypothetical protein
MTPASETAALVEFPPTALGRVPFAVLAPSRDEARRTIDAYCRHWQRHDPSVRPPVEGYDRVWRASGHRWVSP